MWRAFCRYRKAAEDAAREAMEAERENKASQDRHRDAQRLVARSTSISETLRREIERNGWTEMLQNAWGGR